MRICDGAGPGNERPFDEFKPLYGTSLVTGWARLHGRPIGILANAQGVIFSEEAQKATQFIQLANQVDTPLLFLHNTTGYMVGAEYEQGGIIKHGAQMINAVSNSKVPHLSVIMGASYGAGNYGMNGRAYDPRFLFTWPSAKSAVMGPAQLAGVLSIVARAAAEARGQQYDDEADAGMRAFIEQSVEEQSLPFFLSGMLYDDGVIDPRDTRTVLAICLSVIENAPIRGADGLRGVPHMITRLLVANRGEIASRVFATCRRLGIETVAVHSDADAGLPYVGEADTAVHLPGNAPADTYLRIDLLVDAALRSGADAVHPGYGFLSENADFARAVIDAGLIWVGPAPASIEAMGSKVRAKELMRKAGVPVLEAPEAPTEPGPSPAGEGVRRRRRPRDARRTTARPTCRPRSRPRARRRPVAFGDGTVFVEPYVERGRHVEVQVVGHPAGVLVLGERDCSVQRRHQKVVEESPAPGLPDRTRNALHQAAHAAAAAIDYLGAGTVEFLYDPEADRFFFLEMNTRLQVEHPVTELVHGVDLVELQLTVAEGRSPDPRAIGETYGHAIEVRLYAEDPAADWQPQSGLLSLVDVPGIDGAFDLLNRPGLRLDAGFETGSEVSTHYDAMLAKVVSWAPTREQAARRLGAALRGTRVHGVVTNRDLLVAVLSEPAFLAGDVSTAYLDDHPPTAHGPAGDHAVAAALALAERDRLTRTVQQGVPAAWRNVVSQPQVTRFTGSSAPGSARGEAQADDPITVEWYGGRDGYQVDGLTVVSTGSTDGVGRVVLERDGLRTSYDVQVTGDRVDVDAPSGHVSLTVVPRFTDPADAVASGSLLAPMPGTVVAVSVQQGDAVEAGRAVLVLEAMKMQHTVAAPHAGTVTELAVRIGDQVAAGEVLAVVSTSRTDGEPDVPTQEEGDA